ncbi:MAG: hypothetical protein CR997_08780 [Acidobacteria bacterium]|nr:MAG: hypothetical protein CR997_08780 [Acidobacteriota bacterium]
MIRIFLFSLVISSSQFQLFLKNGQTIVCDSYEIVGQMIEINRSGQVFTLPVNRLDLEKTRELKPVEHVKKNGESRKAPQATPKKERTIRIKTSDLKPISSTESEVETTRISYRKLGNGIVVAVTINGSGPYDFILDTGASTTIISPSLVGRLHIEVDEENIPLVGLSGKNVTGKRVKLDTISLGDLSVEKLVCTSFEVTTLRQKEIHGLLGQDFLNYFVVEIDSSSQRITLKKHGQSVESPILSRLEQEGVANQIRDLFNQLGLAYQLAQRSMNEISDIRKHVQTKDKTLIAKYRTHLRRLSGRLIQDRRDLNNIKSQMKALIGPRLPKEMQAEVNREIPCIDQSIQLLSHMKEYCAMLEELLKSRHKNESELKRFEAKLSAQYNKNNPCFSRK